MTAIGEELQPLPGCFDAVFLGSFSSALAQAGFTRMSGELSAALASVAAVSPFLRALMLADPALVEEVVAAPLAASVTRACRLGEDVEEALRRGRRRVALAVALADLCGGASVEAVTEALSDFADAAVNAALGQALREAHERGHIHRADPETSGLFVLAMGKLGGRELNYSSDIDLIVLFDPARAAANALSAGRAVRLTQRLSRILNARTAAGYVFRVDLRLRPDPGSTAVAVSTKAAIGYYQSRARAWERQAMIKARPIAGDRAAAAAFLDALAPSVWRGSYDFSAIDETMDMRERIAAVKGAGAITVPGHNIKVGRGGIREIEFYVQSLQRVVAGRDQRLRGRSTVPMLAALARRGWIATDDCRVLTDAYRYLRRVEHRLQMIDDEQVHTLPDAAGLPRIARMMADDSFEAHMRDTLEAVHARFVGLAETTMRANPILAEAAAASRSIDEALAASFGAKLEVWHAGRYSSLRSERARELLKRLEPALREAVAGARDPAAALEGLDAFLARLPRGIDFLSRLDRQRDLIPVLVLIVAAAPRLAEQLARRVHLLDVLVDPQFYGRALDAHALADALDAALAAASDYEGALDALRVFAQEQMLLIEVRILTGSLLTAEAGEDISTLAALVASRGLRVAQDQYAARHGHISGGGVALIGLGSFGSREMTPASDLDIVFVYDAADESSQSDGAKPLTPGHYFARLAQRFIAALSAQTSRGMAFEVDLRLRPSGRSGPLATHIRSFERYHCESAWVWEQMALTRARVVAGDAALGERAMAAIGAALRKPRDPDTLAAEVLAMRRKLEGLSHKDAKHAPGGLVDIEFIVQFLRLRTGLETTTTQTRRLLVELGGSGALDRGSVETLVDAHRLFRKLMLLFAIAGVSAEPADAPAALKPLLLRAADAPDIDYLTADLAERRVAVRALLEELIGAV